MQNGKQMRFTDAELQIIKTTFKGNDDLLKLLRKVFLPEIDPKAPLNQVIDLWMTVPVKELDPQQAIVNLLARNTVIGHLENCLQQLNVLASLDDTNKAADPANSTK